MGEPADQVSSILEKEARPTAAALGGPLAPPDGDGVHQALGVTATPRASGRVLLDLAVRVVDPVRAGRVVDGRRIPAGIGQPSGQRFPEAEQRQIVERAGSEQVAAAGASGEAAVPGVASAALPLMEPPRLHRPRDAPGGNAVLRGEEVGNEGVRHLVVQQGPRAHVAVAFVLEADARHRVLQAAVDVPGAALDVDVDAGTIELGRRFAQRRHRAEGVGERIHPKREGGPRLRGRQGDHDADGVAFHRRRPPDLDLAAFQKEVPPSEGGETLVRSLTEEADLASRAQLRADAGPKRFRPRRGDG